MRLTTVRSALPCLMPLLLLFFALDANAELNSQGLMDDVLKKFKDQGSGWGDIFKSYASWLFWTLATISLTWTFGLMALRKADIGEFFAEFIRFSIFTGFFWWLLDNGPTFANAIIDSLTQIGGTANQKIGYQPELTPSGIVDIGFRAIALALDKASFTSPIPSLAGFVFAFGVLLMSLMIGINMLMLLISAWILSYAGIFILGFGGGKWTQDMALNYYKTVLGIGLQIMTMLLLVGIGQAIMEEYYRNISKSPPITEMAIVFVVAFIVYQLSSKVPSMIAGMASGGGGGGDMGIGSFAGGAAVGAAMGSAGAAMGASASAVKGVGSAAAKAPGAAFNAAASATGALQGVAALKSSLQQDAARAGGGASAFMKAAGMRVDGAVGARAQALFARIGGMEKSLEKSFKDKTDNSAGGRYASQTKAKDAEKNSPAGE